MIAGDSVAREAGRRKKTTLKALRAHVAQGAVVMSFLEPLMRAYWS